MSLYESNWPLYLNIIPDAEKKEHFTWRERVALFVIKDDMKTYRKRLQYMFSLSYKHADKILRQFANDGFCRTEKRRSSRIVDYIFNQKLRRYAKKVYQKKVKPHTKFSWKEYADFVPGRRPYSYWRRR